MACRRQPAYPGNSMDKITQKALSRNLAALSVRRMVCGFAAALLLVLSCAAARVTVLHSDDTNLEAGRYDK